MKNFYSNLSTKKFKIYTIIFSALGDIAIIFYIWNKFADYKKFENILKIYLNQTNQNLNPIFYSELYQLMLQNLKIFLGVFIILHLFQYISHWFDKKYAYMYIKLLAWIAAPGCLMIGFFSIIGGSWIEKYLIIQSFLYFLIIMGMQKFKYQEIKNVEPQN